MASLANKLNWQSFSFFFFNTPASGWIERSRRRNHRQLGLLSWMRHVWPLICFPEYWTSPRSFSKVSLQLDANGRWRVGFWMSVHLMHLTHANSRASGRARRWYGRNWSPTEGGRMITAFGWTRRSVAAATKLPQVTIEDPFSMEATAEGRAEEGSEAAEGISG